MAIAQNVANQGHKCSCWLNSNVTKPLLSKAICLQIEAKFFIKVQKPSEAKNNSQKFN